MSEPIEQANPNGDGIQTNSETIEVKTEIQTPTVSESEKALQAEYTRNRQELIETTSELVSANPSKLHTIKDSKLKDSVSKKLFDMGYNEAIAVFGNDFASIKADEAKKENEPNSLEKEVRLLKYRAEQNEIDRAIANQKLLNPQLFENTNIEEKVREELANISSSLPIEERVSRAVSYSHGSFLDSKSIAYQILNKGKVNGGSSSSTNTSTEVAKTDMDFKIEAISALMKKNMGLK